MMRKLTFILFLFTLSISAQAQSLTDGSQPFVGGKYLYSIGMEDNTNTASWTLVNAAKEDKSAAITKTDNENIIIDYTSLVAGDYTLRFTETKEGCIAVRELPIRVYANGFNINIVDNNAYNCNPESGNVHVQGDQGTVTFEYTVTRTMATGDWAFNYSNAAVIEGGTGNIPTITAVDGKIDTGAKTITAGDGVASVVITVTYTGFPIDLDLTNTFGVTASTITSGTTNLVAGTIDPNKGGTVKGLPNTGNISFK
ncbi:hypothetical protein K5X82_13240 [Halosquirtibacter xylanolyticus]|uniref:hypothetical protein n=1 Tax=Halosquirtibacter xylanolyticus TaxID=3374599 RepID=UPI003749DB9E|nr:hypothetical protein K5X82_13240 [Prolixibacteraceae bacterium]